MKGMKVFEKSPKLSIQVLTTTVLLTPNHAGNADGDDVLGGQDGSSRPRTDTVVEGTVTLSLPSVRRIKRLQVELIGRQNVLIQDRYDSYEVLANCVELDRETELLSPGDHRYAFSFVIPSTTAPYDRNIHGRTYHKLVATAVGLGKLGSDIVAEKPFYLIANHSTTGDVPPGFSLERQFENAYLGPVGLVLNSKYLLIAGYLRLSLVMPIITAPVKLDDVRVNLCQTFHLQNLQDPSRSDVVAKTIQLWSLLEHEAPGILRQGQDFQLSRQFRLPCDDVVRPSTPEPSITGIRVSHQLQVAIRYTPLSTNQKLEIKATIDATISSCCAMFGSLQLPSYGQSRSEILKEFRLHESCESCLCNVADQCELDEYSIPPEDLKRARLQEQAGPAWKSDTDYEAEILARRQREWYGRGSPSPSPSLTSGDGPPSYASANSSTA